MRALILSVSTGGGHAKAAEAIKESIMKNEPQSEVQIIDTIKYISPFLDKLVVGTYLKSIRYYPSFFKFLYKHSDEEGRFTKSSTIGNDYLTNKLYPTIVDFEPDILIATHAFTAQILSILRKKFQWHKPSLVVMTDYASHAFWVHRNVDAYIVSNEDMIEELTLRGRKRNQIYPYGIPISEKFLNISDRENILSKYNLKQDKKIITITGGSLGIGNIEEILNEILKIRKPYQIIVLTGKNEKLYEKMSELQTRCDHCLTPLEYCEEMNDILSITDLLITKPGGLTITESFITGTPLAIYSAIPGHEVQNADYLIRHGLAVDLGTGEHCGPVIENLLEDGNFLQTMKDKSKANAKPHAAQNIFELCKELIEEKSLNIDAKRIDL